MVKSYLDYLDGWISEIPVVTKRPVSLVITGIKYL